MKTTLTLMIIVLLTSCSIQKRSFNSGYYISWKGKFIKNDNQTDNTLASNTNSSYTNEVRAELPEFIIREENNENLISQPSKIITNTTSISDTNKFESEHTNLKSSLNASSTEIISQKIYQKSSNKDKKHETKKDYSHSRNGGKLQLVALILCIVLGLIGVHRFYLGYSGLGILYLLTLGLFGIGWIIDIILLIIPNGLTPKGKNNYKE